MGECAAVAIEDGTSCEDGSTCTLNESCQTGACEPAAGQLGDGTTASSADPVPMVTLTDVEDLAAGFGWRATARGTPAQHARHNQQELVYMTGITYTL